MLRAPFPKRLAAPATAVALALTLGACGATVSTSAFKGSEREVAQTVANLQSHANASELDKLCEKDITKALREQLKGKSECEQAFKRQLSETDNLELKVLSVKIEPGGTKASAKAESTFAGKKGVSEIKLVSEGGAWRVAALGPPPT